MTIGPGGLFELLAAARNFPSGENCRPKMGYSWDSWASVGETSRKITEAKYQRVAASIVKQNVRKQQRHVTGLVGTNRFGFLLVMVGVPKKQPGKAVRLVSADVSFVMSFRLCYSDTTLSFRKFFNSQTNTDE